MTRTNQPSSLRRRLRQATPVRHCHLCGGRLQRRYVRAEKTFRHVCRRCGEITYINPKIVVGLIPVMPDGRVALLERGIEPGKGLWSYPAGFMEMGETVEKAAIRETQEEIRAAATIKGFVGIYSYPDTGVVTVVFWGRVKKGESPAAGQETSAVQFYHHRKLPWKKLAFRSTVESLRDWLKSL